jgi:phenylpyruvate tautomerase PptA (4-oxalocrotonate tautomerase family)
MVRVEDVASAIADAALGVPGVARLSPGRGVELSTPYPGGKVIGVRLAADGVTVAITVDRVPLPPIASEVTAAARRVLSAIGDDRPVTVVIDDVLPEALSRRVA